MEWRLDTTGLGAWILPDSNWQGKKFFGLGFYHVTALSVCNFDGRHLGIADVRRYYLDRACFLFCQQILIFRAIIWYTHVGFLRWCKSGVSVVP